MMPAKLSHDGTRVAYPVASSMAVTSRVCDIHGATSHQTVISSHLGLLERPLVQCGQQRRNGLAEFAEREERLAAPESGRARSPRGRRSG